MATKISPAGIALIKGFEGFRSCPYLDAVKVPTIGYGETKGVTMSSACISEPQAARLLARRVNADFAPAVVAADKKKQLNQHQFDALCSFVYNCGTGALSTSTGIGRAVRRGDFKAAADELLKWDKAGGQPLAGLTRRRHEERELFLSGASQLEGYKSDEKHWIREYDKLLRAKKDRPRREHLRKLMTKRRKRIWAQAQKHGWQHYHRRERYHSLLARTR